MKVVSFFESIKVGGGVENVQANLSRGLVEKGYDFTHLVLQDRNPRNDYKGKIVSLNEEFIFGFGIKKIISLFRLGYKVSKYCKREKIDVIIGQGDFFYMVVSISKILFGNRSKTIGVVHTTIGIWPKYIKNILIFLLKKLDKVIITSVDEYNTFIDKYGFLIQKVNLIYNGIDIQKMDLMKLEHVTDTKFDKFTFINIARLTYQKGQDRLLKAYNVFYSKYPDSQLIILGEGDLKEEYLNILSTLESKENVLFLGNKTNFYKYLYSSDCFVLSSNFEGFPIILIESICMGKPVISTYCDTGPKELFDPKYSFDDKNDKVFLHQYGLLSSLKNDSVENLFLAMEQYYLNRNISYNTEYFRSHFGLSTHIQLWDNELKKI